MATVGIWRGEPAYSDSWRDGDDYPEKRALRELSRLLGASDGNLLRGVIRPGQRVAIKPNWVLHFHAAQLEVFSVITHSAVLRAVVDLAYEALEGNGEIVIADAPQYNTDWDELMRVTQVGLIADHYRRRHDFEIPIRDLRKLATRSAYYTRDEDRIELAGDPRGYSVVDFGAASAFVGMDHPERVYGADYDRAETRKHHNEERHEYLVARTILESDVVVHVPKLKVHKKVGITVNAKGMVGINGDKNWIAHYRIGPPDAGGDEFPAEETPSGRARARALRWVIDHLLRPGGRARQLAFDALRAGYHVVKPVLVAIARRNPALAPGDQMLHGGNWHGNDTAWRMTADLARAVLYADANGTIHTEPQRRFFSIVDGILAGEGEGPLAPTPKPCGVLVAGELFPVDLVCGRLMGFDWRRMRYQRWLLEESPHHMGVEDPETIELRTNVPEWEALMRDPDRPDLSFEPHPGWAGKIELERRAEAHV